MLQIKLIYVSQIGINTFMSGVIFSNFELMMGVKWQEMK